MKKGFAILLLFLTIQGYSQNRFSNDLLLKVIYQHQYEANTEALLQDLKNSEAKYRLAACMAFASVQDSAAIDALKEVAKNDLNSDVRKAAVFSLGQLRLNSISKYFISKYDEKPYRTLQSEMLMAIGKGAVVADTAFYDQLKLKKKDTAQMKAYMYSVYQAYRRKPLSSGIKKNLELIRTHCLDERTLWMYWEMKRIANPIKLIQIKDEMPPMHVWIEKEHVFRQLANDSNPYHLISQLKSGMCANALLENLAFDSSLALVVRTYCMETLLDKKEYVDTVNLKRLMTSGNAAFISMACEKIREDSTNKDQKKISIEYLERLKHSLIMPRDFEVWVDIEKTQAWVLNKPYRYRSWFEQGYTNPIDWAAVVRIQENQKVKITTNKGVIVLLCKVNDAPASVAHFLALVDSGYYNGKYFHRMVPQFVVQGGCPRGDGWGALNWVQRSEFSNRLLYQPGSVGLASSGKDSEGVQFFVTHTFTPHLDGRYTIFAEVVEGMPVVNLLQVGDQILSIERI